MKRLMLGFFEHCSIILAIFGVFISILGYLINLLVPMRLHPLVWLIVGMILVFNGAILGRTIKNVVM